VVAAAIVTTASTAAATTSTTLTSTTFLLLLLSVRSDDVDVNELMVNGRLRWYHFWSVGFVQFRVVVQDRTVDYVVLLVGIV
jgi:hypothetical protein